MTKQDYMWLPKERLAELLVERDNVPSFIPYLPPYQSRPLCWEPGGTCTNPHHDCINCPAKYSSGGTITTPNTQSGTSTSTLHGSASVTDGKEHNSSFTD